MRFPTRPDRRGAGIAARRYTAALRKYLADRALPFVDLSESPVLEADHYGIGDHLNEAGRQRFTALLARHLEPHLPSR